MPFDEARGMTGPQVVNGKCATDRVSGTEDGGGHVWRTRSRHPTSNGTVSYQSCDCGLWRVLRLADADVLADQIGATRCGFL